MGGALAVRVASRNVISTLVGLAAIDVVEGEYDGIYLKLYILNTA